MKNDIQKNAMFFNDYENWCGVFSKEEVDRELEKIEFHKLVQEFGVVGDAPKWLRVSEFARRGDWRVEKEVTVDGHRATAHYYENRNIYYVPGQYQGLLHGNMLKNILFGRYPWLKKYVCSFYETHFSSDRTDEFYVEVAKEGINGHKSLYVPYLVFLDGDADAICKRNEKYLRWYTKNDVVWETMKNLPITRKFLKKVAGA